MGETYIVLEESSALITDLPYDRCRPGFNHLAFHAASAADVDAIIDDLPQHGWTLLFPDRDPFAGGADYYAAYLERVMNFAENGVGPPIPEAPRRALASRFPRRQANLCQVHNSL